ncbi:SDR family oxidoreductase [Mucilaginibacter sp. Mucisp86]|uniref:SDR family oxidoreductase n=1 Tax=Mucilaginibacter sp. Mucisp86 TaxID=3243060 RepID=UPI0039B3F122
MTTTNSNSNTQVLVTGGSGFIAVHYILQLIEAGYKVKTTVRSLNRETEVRDMLKTGGVEAGDRLSFIAANLAADANWAEAVKDCTYVLHVASPTPLKGYKHEDEMIIPAREGVLRVLTAARDAGVKRVVFTSAFGAVGFGHKARTTPFNETDWTPINDSIPAYQKSKTLSEQAAWKFIETEGQGLEMVTVNPVAVAGPVLGPDYSHSIQLVQNMLFGKLKGTPRINTGLVDVRDVADLHLRAMTNPAAKGQRFLAISGESLWMIDIAKILKRRMGNYAEKVKAQNVPNWLVRLTALWNPTAKAIIPMLDQNMNATSEKAQRMLGWSPRSAEEAIVATAESLIQLGIIK